MNSKQLPARAFLAVLFLTFGTHIVGQVADAPPANSISSDEDVLLLSPFVVSSEEDQGYAAKSTLAGTRIRTELKDVGSSISVVTKKFLDDTKSNKSEELLVYAMNTEVAGQGGNFLGQGDSKYLTNVPTTVRATTRVRGLADADNTRDFFLTDIPWDSYNTGRVDLQRGPNSILFGIGSPAGIINSSPNAAAFKNSNAVEAQFGSFGSMRYSADFNRVLVSNELAVRLSLLRDDAKFRQDPAFRDDHRIYGAARWDPGFLNKGKAHTSLRASYEKGNIDANLPRNTPPLDAITSWYSVLNKQLYDPNQVTLGMRSTSVGLSGIGGNTSHSSVITVSPGGAQVAAFMAPNDDVPAEHYYMPIGVGTSDSIAVRSKFPGYTIDAWKAKSLTDPSIFDFYNHLLEGPNKSEFLDFDALNIALSQTFMEDQFGFEVAYDKQSIYSGGSNYLSSGAVAVTLDILTKLPFGTPNPDVRRPMFASHGGYGEWTDRTREVARATAFADLDFADYTGRDSLVTKIFGRNTFTALASRQDNETLYANYKNYHTVDPFISRSADADIHTASFYTDDLFFYNYLGAAIPTSASSASGLNLEGLKGRVMPQSTTINAWNYQLSVPEAMRHPFVTTIAMPVMDNLSVPDRAKNYRGGSKSSERVDSTAIVWQGYWLDGTVIPMFGYRTDKQTVWAAPNPPVTGDRGQYFDIWSPDWKLPDEPNSTEVNSKTYSVVTHLPKSWRNKLPGRMDVSLIYNESENVQPGAGRLDVLGNQVADPAGKTKEYGVAISGFDDRLSLKVVKYDTVVKNAKAGDAISAEYQYIGFTESWGQWRAFETRDAVLDPNRYYGSVIYGYATGGHPVKWLPDGAPKASYTQAELDATWAKQKAAVDDWFAPENQVPQQFVDHWGLLDYNNSGPVGFPRGSVPGGLQVTADTISEGYEIELIANPVKGLNIALNVAKTNAKRTNLAESFVDWIEKRWDVFQGPAGDIRFWGTSTPELGELPGTDDRDDPVNGVAQGNDGWTARGQYRRTVMSGYWLFRALEDADVPELKPWTFNVVGDYAFQSGALLGANVGGAYRWASANVVGFPVVKDAEGVESYDVTQPYEGSTEGATDFWIGYVLNINKRLKWRTQINVRNVFADDHLSRVTVNPDGGPAAYRIPEPRTIVWSNTIEF